MDLPQHSVQVVVADRRGEGILRPEEILPNEGGEAHRRRVDVWDGEEESGARRITTRRATAQERVEGEVELDRVELELLEVPHALGDAIPQQLATGGPVVCFG